MCLGKSSKTGKAKSSKKTAEPETSKKDKTSSTIPRINPLFNGDSDDESLGQEPPHLYYEHSKFLSVLSPAMKEMIKPKSLLAPEFHELCDEFSNLVLHSSAKQTWAKHCSAWKLFADFCTEYGVKFALPINKEYVRAFVAWASSKRHLKSSTIRSYISSLNVAHALSNVDCPNLSSDMCTKLALKGVKNYSDPSTVSRATRLPISFDLLKVLGHRISSLNWGDLAKQVLWSACTTSFFLFLQNGGNSSGSSGEF